MSENPCDKGRAYWLSMFGLEWEYDPAMPRFKRFGVRDRSRGVGSRATPITAYLALRRWRKEPARPR